MRIFWQGKVKTHCEFQCHNGDHFKKGEMGSVKGETKSADFLARESVNSSPSAVFWQGKL